MKKLTDEQKKDYIEGFGTSCPYCESEDITGGDWDFGTGQFYQDVRCNSCGEKWTDIYTLTSVEEKT